MMNSSLTDRTTASPDVALAGLASRHGAALDQDMTRIPRGVTTDDLARAIGILQRALVPMKELPEPAKTAGANRMKDALRPIGAKLMPNLAEDRCTAWLVALVAALSDLPVRCVTEAAETGLHHVFQFPNEVEAFLRKDAVERRERWQRGVQSLERIRAAILRVSDPKPALPDPRKQTSAPRPWTIERLRSTPSEILAVGRAGGFIPADLLAQYDAEREEQDSPQPNDDSMTTNGGEA
jgi:hypothetical protein